jgi:hypothetical protein
MSSDKELNTIQVVAVITLEVAVLILAAVFYLDQLGVFGAVSGLLGSLGMIVGLVWWWAREALRKLGLIPMPSEKLPQFDDERKVMLCEDGREFPFSEITVHSDHDPGFHRWERPSKFREEKWVYLRAGTERINLRQFKDTKQAREYAREMKVKVATGSSGTPWFPPDD